MPETTQPANSSMVHAIVIMRDSGEVLIEENFGGSINPALMSGFLAALSSFGRELLKDQVLDTVELGQYRLFLDRASVQGEELIFAALAERRANMASIRPKLRQVQEEFISAKFDAITTGYRGEITQFEDFKERLRKIIQKKVIFLTQEMRSDILGIFQRLYELSEYAIGAALLTQSGDVLHSFMDPSDLENITRLLEGRFLAGARNLKELISIEERGILVLIGNENVIAAVMFSSMCPLGTAELFASRFAEKINECISGPSDT